MWILRAAVCIVILFSVATQAWPQASQNPSPMVENTRAHHRVEPTEHPGIKRSIDAGLPSPVTLFIPESATRGDGSLLIHFMGADYVPIDAVVKTGSYDALAVVNLGSGSSAFERSFREEGAFEMLVSAVENASVRLEGIDLSAFSAGYGAVRAILLRHADRIDGVLLLDALHTGYIPETTALAEGGALDTSLLAPFARFAERAIAGEKALVLTHSEVFPGTFASTTETSDYLLEVLGLRREAVLKWGPVGMQQLSEAGDAGFEVLGFAGNSAPDHVDHLHGMAAFLRLLRSAHARTDSVDDRALPQR